MRKIIFSLPFLIYYCIAPVNYDKAGINRGWNYYGGGNIFYGKGEYTSCSTRYKYNAIGGEVSGGLYYGIDKFIGVGLEGALGGTNYEEQIKDTINNYTEIRKDFIITGYTNAFLKFSFPISSLKMGLKIGGGYPFYTYLNLSLGFPENERFGISYTNLGLSFHSLNINYAISNRTVFSLGIYGYQSSDKDYARGIFAGIGIRK